METLTRSGSMKCVEDYALVPRIPSALITKPTHNPFFFRSKLFLHRKSSLTFTTAGRPPPQLGLTLVTLILPCIFH